MDTIECSEAYPHLVHKKKEPELYYVYQWSEYYYTAIREWRVQKATFEHYCGLLIRTATLCAKMIPRMISVMIHSQQVESK